MTNALVRTETAHRAIAEARSVDVYALPSVSLSDAKNLPATSGIYIAELSGEILYVGQARNIRKRWGGHHRKDELLSLGDDVRLFWIECEPGTLDQNERWLIEELSPSINNRSQRKEATPERKQRAVTHMAEMFGDAFLRKFMPRFFEEE